VNALCRVVARNGSLASDRRLRVKQVSEDESRTGLRKQEMAQQRNGVAKRKLQGAGEQTLKVKPP
jgi:hypothetical protein